MFQRLLVSGFIGILGIGCGQHPQPTLQESTHSLGMSMDGHTLWNLQMDPNEGKPYVHPLGTTEGEVFSALRPDDHPWHRGLWFSWKYINGVNYWEEDRNTGQSDGQTLLLGTERKDLPNGNVQIDMQLAYAPAETGVRVLEEQRTLVFHPPESSDTYYIDWSSTFTTLDEDVILDRTPISGEKDGKVWGGYAGYSLRMNKEVAEGTFTNSKGQTGKDSDRQPAKWMTYSSPRGSSVLFLDHPDNLNFPSKWYANEEMPYFSPAIIHDGPYTINSGESLQLQYRLVVSSQTIRTTVANQEWQNWTEEH